ncbi:uncharacterized protein LOC113499619 isoform X1 [Trichoplusia ni]|uniref:Uncharacterized protein LOC113499619 isoform X1 n=1 Tax=Trichoplusia ni TaxID=7111 RepID=A0A7E5W6U7_TRINI|nr:uncharacterized protein LOC113499619 isoform X1 [Trichoplusia ni]XP_026735952.1 uncharacterized protein LOC113499619 isoform X1 [Trichoplusia ni]
MAKEKRKKNEDELERRRIARREKYKRIKSDPAKYAIEKNKKKEAYLRRKSEQKVKNINEMSPREQRAQRKRWRENSKRYLEKKANERKIQEITMSSLVLEAQGKTNDKELSDPLCEQNVKKEMGKESKQKIYQRKMKALKLKHAMEKKEMTLLIKKYQNRCRILTQKLNKIKNIYTRTGFEENIVLPTQLPIDTSNCHNVKQTTAEHVILKSASDSIRRPSSNLRNKCLKYRFQRSIKQGSNSIQELIKLFYEDDINSRIGAGKKQYVKKYGLVKQRRYLLDSVKNLHTKFLEDNPNLRISYVTFTRLRPFWVFLPRDDRETCACTVHTNMDLLICSLRKYKIIDVKNYQDMLRVLCCDKYNTKCVGRHCEACKNRVISYKEFNNDEEIVYHEWSRDKKKVGTKEINIVKKFTRKIKPRDLIFKLENSLPKFFLHTVNILNQYQAITLLKQSLSYDETILHMDFSENYSYKFAAEVQSLHFGGSRGQVSLHTVVAYLKEERETVHQCLCTVSECTRHDSPAVWAHLQKALEFVFEKRPSITTAHILTDSPTSQYRNKQIFYILTQLRDTFPSLKFVTWNYQESGHGKGAPDGVGAVVKRTADHEVKCGRDVGDFATFLRVVSENVKNVEIKVVEEHEIKEKELLLPKDISPFKGTMLVHQVVWNSRSEFLEFRKLSCFLCIDKICEHDNKHMQLHKIYKSVVDAAVQNIKIIPPSKRITVLNDVSIQYHNRSNIASTSGTGQIRKFRKEENVKRLADVKFDWTNQTFISTKQKVSGGHEEAFLRFINERSSENPEE